MHQSPRADQRTKKNEVSFQIFQITKLCWSLGATTTTTTRLRGPHCNSRKVRSNRPASSDKYLHRSLGVQIVVTLLRTRGPRRSSDTIKINNSLWVSGFQFFDTYSREFDTLLSLHTDGSANRLLSSQRSLICECAALAAANQLQPRRRRDMKNHPGRAPMGAVRRFIGPGWTRRLMMMTTENENPTNG